MSPLLENASLRLSATSLLVAAILVFASSRGAGGQSRAAGEAPPDRVDYLTFAQGAIPVAIGGAGAGLGASFEHAVRAVDGDVVNFTVASRAPGDADTDFVYELPALTTFDRLAVPNILETPAPNQTFTRLVEVHGSAESASAGFRLLGSATLATHRARGLVTEIPVGARIPVRWIRLRLVGGINVLQPQMGLEFSEIIGNGVQESPAMVTHFTGAWRTMGNRMRLRQKGAVVSGCYDGSGVLTGTVTGNILRATGVSRADNTPSAFLLSVAADGTIRGVRSSNNGPFRLYTLDRAGAGVPVDCAEPSPPALGCGSVIHGINFDFDSATIRPESEPVLAELFKGLQQGPAAGIVIEGHTSSEGSEAYNMSLSLRRAEAVVADLVKRGIALAQLRGMGVGEGRPIAANTDESGRALNRRVEVKCR